MALGDSGPLQLGIPRLSSVADVFSASTGWRLPPPRSDTVERIYGELLQLIPPSPSGPNDSFYWSDTFSFTAMPRFSTSKAWKQNRLVSPVVSWHKDRQIAWGLDVSHVCVLCDEHVETLDYLFFRCRYSSALWPSILRSSFTPTALAHYLT
ncbi:PREDICTED: uncharacterized protein LOC104817127 [Tarenaya hassleriana]|uniref:uncharacterized protein LOC104817127 n=1 Tax=Tarenaya hassleriana TaxID=28532 RepID=UPI00053C6CD4|nr:PREDICTED: uncharacterized protein LOC104817127 [Tarenaya hassleriana]